MRLVLLLYLLLAACSEHPDPPQPHGKLIPIDSGSLAAQYHGDELYPGMARPAP